MGGANKVLYLNTDNAVDTSTTMLNNTLPTSSVFSVGANYNTNDGVLANGFKFRENDHAHNGAGRTYIYCSFASNPFFATVPATAR